MKKAEVMVKEEHVLDIRNTKLNMIQSFLSPLRMKKCFTHFDLIILRNYLEEKGIVKVYW